MYIPMFASLLATRIGYDLRSLLRSAFDSMGLLILIVNI